MPGSEAMIAVCDQLCDLVDGCDGSMLDHSHDVNSGLCTLHTGTPVLTEACFFHSSAGGIITDEASCAVPSAGLPGRDATKVTKFSRKFTVDTSEPNRNTNAGALMSKTGKKGKAPAGNVAHITGDGACVRDTLGGTLGDTGVHPTGKTKNGWKKKSKRLGMGMGMGMGKHNKGKDKDTINNDHGAKTVASATTGARDIVVGFSVAAVLITAGLGALACSVTRRAKGVAASQKIVINAQAPASSQHSSSTV